MCNTQQQCCDLIQISFVGPDLTPFINQTMCVSRRVSRRKEIKAITYCLQTKYNLTFTHH